LVDYRHFGTNIIRKDGIGSLFLNVYSKNYDIMLGDYHLRNFEIIFHETHGRTTPIDIFVFVLKTDKYSEFKNLDLKDDLKIFHKGKKVFDGHVENMILFNQLAVLECKGFVRSFQSLKLGLEYLNFSIDELEPLMFAIARSFSPRENIKPDEYMKSKMKIYEREFTVIVPATNLILNTEEFVVDDNIIITRNLSENETESIKESKYYANHPDWNSDVPKIRTKIIADNYYDAMLKGYRRINRLIELLTFRNDLSFTSYHNHNSIEFFDKIFNSLINLSKIVFCKENNSLRSLFLDFNTIERYKMETKYLESKYFEIITKLKEISAKDDYLSDAESLIQDSLRWLRLSIASNEPSIKIISLWNSIEFAVNGIKTDHVFTKSDISNILQSIEKDIAELDLNPIQTKAIKDKINMLNDAPLLAKIRSVIEKYNIPFNQEEMKIIKELRDKRNELQHGKTESALDEEKLGKLRTLIERIILARANSLTAELF
jgi:hypothetical protein